MRSPLRIRSSSSSSRDGSSRSGRNGVIFGAAVLLILVVTVPSSSWASSSSAAAPLGRRGPFSAFVSSSPAAAATWESSSERITRRDQNRIVTRRPPPNAPPFYYSSVQNLRTTLHAKVSSTSSKTLNREEGKQPSKNNKKSDRSKNKVKKNSFSISSSTTSRGNTTKDVADTPAKSENKNSNHNNKIAAPPLSARIESLRELSTSTSSSNGITQSECDKLLAACVAADEWDAVLEVLDIYQHMADQQSKKNGDDEDDDDDTESEDPSNKNSNAISMDHHSTYRACLKACFEASNAASALEILNAMKEANVHPDGTDIGLVVVTMCRKQRQEQGWWREALKLVQSTHAQVDSQQKQQQQLSVEVYDAVLACMVQDRQWKPAVRLLRDMEVRSSTPPSAATSSAEHAKQLQGVAAPTLSTYRTVIECCVAARQPEQAVQVLQSCVRRGLTPTIYAFELVIASLCNTNNKNNQNARSNAGAAPQWRRALQIMSLMERLGVDKTLDIYNNVLSATSKARAASQAKNLLWQMKKQNVKPNILSFNSVISACASTKRWKDALSVLDQCHREPGVQPDIYTYTNVMRACAKGGQYRRALSLLQVVKDKKLPLDAYAYTAVIEACAKSRMWTKALELLDEMQQRGIAPTKVTYSVTINALGNGGQYEKALALLDTMRRENLYPNLITYNSAITAISKEAKQVARQSDKSDNSDDGSSGELWKRALELLDQMRADGIEPDGFSFSAAISCCGSQGRWKEALELLEAMEHGGPRTRPNRVSYTAAIASCGRAGQVEHALRLFRRMKDQGLSADRVSYNSVFSALRVAKRGDLAVELWDEMLGTKQTIATKIATARADESMTPDIITVTDAIGAISSMEDYGREQEEAVDKILSHAVKQGILLREGSIWEVDLNGLSLPVSRAVCRYVFRRILEAVQAGETVQDLSLFTGIGVGHGPASANRRQQTPLPPQHRWRSNNTRAHGGDAISVPCPTSLREYIQDDVLLTDFEPPIVSCIPCDAHGTVLIEKESLVSWVESQNAR